MKTAQQIILTAFRKFGGMGDNESLTPQQEAAGMASLTPMISSFNQMGMPIWKMERITVPLSNFAVSSECTIGPGQTVVTSTTPLKAHTATRVDSTSNVAVEIYGRERFYLIPSPNARGAPIACYFRPTPTNGVLSIWPLPDSYWQNQNLIVDMQLEFTSVSSGSSVPNFPDWWEEAIIYNLAVRLAPEYGLAIPDRQVLITEAEKHLTSALSFDYDPGSLFLRPRPNWSDSSGVF